MSNLVAFHETRALQLALRFTRSLGGEEMKRETRPQFSERAAMKNTFCRGTAAWRRRIRRNVPWRVGAICLNR
jgi:hypothetical protein